MNFGQLMCELLSKKPTYSTKDLVKLAENTHNITSKVIIAMMTENTGDHLLDSGGVYGRAWQTRQRIQDWDEIPTIKWNGDCFSMSLYHYLNDNLKYDPELDKTFHEFCEQEENKEFGYSNLMKDFINQLKEDYVIDADFIGGGNTYNDETMLDSGIIVYYSVYNKNGDDVVIVRTHNGCDSRGGYSTPHVFRAKEVDNLWGLREVELYCNCGVNLFSDDNGYNFSLETYGSKGSFSDMWIKSKEIELDIEDQYDKVLLCPCCGNLIDIAGNEYKLSNEERWNFVKDLWFEEFETDEELKEYAQSVDFKLSRTIKKEIKRKYHQKYPKVYTWKRLFKLDLKF